MAVCITAWLAASLALSTPGAALQRAHKVAARANRLDVLLRREHALTTAETKELAGLTHADTYDESTFSAAHAAFKDAHNRAFVDLAMYCGGADTNLFYLDGPGGKTTQTLIANGFDRTQLFTANWHASTCAALHSPPHSLPAENIAKLLAEDALRTHFCDVPFSALYLDGCGGATRPIISAIRSLFAIADTEPATTPTATIGSPTPTAATPPPPPRHLPARMAVGFTLTEAEPTGRSIMDREVTRGTSHSLPSLPPRGLCHSLPSLPPRGLSHSLPSLPPRG